jgi:hypothetical protein
MTATEVAAMKKQILTQGNLRQTAATQRLTRAEMHAYYIAIVTMTKLVFERPTINPLP